MRLSTILAVDFLALGFCIPGLSFSDIGANVLALSHLAKSSILYLLDRIGGFGSAARIEFVSHAGDPSEFKGRCDGSNPMRLLQVGQKAVVDFEEFSKRGLKFLVASAQCLVVALQALVFGSQNFVLGDEVTMALAQPCVSRAGSLRYLSDGLSGQRARAVAVSFPCGTLIPHRRYCGKKLLPQALPDTILAGLL